MKNLVFASLIALAVVSQAGYAQAVQKAKEAKKEMKAEKKLDKAQELKSNARTGKGLEVAGVSDPKTRMDKAAKKERKAVKKEMKSDAKAIKAVAKTRTKKADDVANN